jgi:general secretion pathway protein D
MMLGAMSQMQSMAAGSGYGAGGLIGGGMNGMNGMNGMSPYGGMGGMSPYGGMGGMSPYGMMPGMQGMYGQNPYGANTYQTAVAGAPMNPAGAAPTDQTGQYAGASGGRSGTNQRQPHIIPNPLDNTILIQSTSAEYDQILSLLRQLDVAPRQVLIDAKIYEVDLNGTFSAGVSAFLDKVGNNGGSRVLSAASTAAGLTLSTGALVLRSHELLAALSASETKSNTRIISAPSIIATDSIPATMNVGSEVPVLTSQAVTGAQQGGNSLFSNTVSNRSTGVTLSITARINSSGIVTLIVNQNVSSPQGAAAGGIQSPSFQNRSFQTQLTVQDGDTIAIGGIITESDLQGSGGVPFLNRIPGIGYAFGSKSRSKARTELIVFLTPRVIYDTNQMVEATDEIKSKLKKVQKLIKDDRP